MKFVQYDPNTGVILSSGEMPEDAIDHMLSQGYNFLKTGEVQYPTRGYRVNLDTLEVHTYDEEVDSNKEAALLKISMKNALTDELARTDYTQAADATEHMTTDMIAAFRSYRQLIRVALTKTTVQEMYDAIPLIDPTGERRFGRIEFLMTPKPPLQIISESGTIVTSNTA